jgi:hypothetical protein
VQELDPVDLGWALKKALDEKHVLVYVEEPAAAALLRARNWDGALPPAPVEQDFLMVVDTNVGFNKVDPNVMRSIHYLVDLTDVAEPQARLSVRYQNRSSRPVGACVQESRYGDTYADMMDRCYWDYVRIYVPSGSALMDGPDLALPAGSLLARSEETALPRTITPALEEGGWPVWAGFFDLPPLGEREMAWEYRLPAGVVEQRAGGNHVYRLRVQKQAGTLDVPLSLDVRLPPGAELVEGLAAVETDLGLDREFLVVFRIEEAGP